MRVHHHDALYIVAVRHFLRHYKGESDVYFMDCLVCVAF